MRPYSARPASPISPGMWLDLAALGILLAAAFVGMVRGTLVSTVRLAGAVGSYVGAWWLAPRVAPWVEAQFQVGGTFSVVAGGFASFVVLLIGVEGLSQLVRILDHRWRDGAERSLADRLGGAGASLVAGFAFAVLVAWLAFAVDALRAQGNEALPSTEGSRFAPVARNVIRGFGEWMLGDRGPSGTAVARAASDPVEAMERVERLFANPHLVDLKDDDRFWMRVEAGEYEHAVSRASFLALAYDGSTRREFAALGLVDEEAARSSAAFRDASVEALAAVAPRLQAIREDPALARLAEDPEVRTLVDSGDTLALLRHPDVRDLLSRALH